VTDATLVAPIKGAFFAEPPFAVGAQIPLSEEAVHHIRVVRLNVGDAVTLRDGAGHIANGTLIRVTKSQAVVEVASVDLVEPAAPIHLLVPVADRDRTLWLAEKAAELNVASWRPVLWHRSKSVSPRGEGQIFRGKVRARMISAMLQSRSAWLPDVYPEAPPDRGIAALPDTAARVVLDASGAPMVGQTLLSPVILAIGPEGGFELAELDLLEQHGFARCTLGPSVLRFETAAVAAVAVARAIQLAASAGRA